MPRMTAAGTTGSGAGCAGMVGDTSKADEQTVDGGRLTLEVSKLARKGS